MTASKGGLKERLSVSFKQILLRGSAKPRRWRTCGLLFGFPSRDAELDLAVSRTRLSRPERGRLMSLKPHRLSANVEAKSCS